jgi:DNA-binding transcriptional LysR family regulator
VVAVLPRFVAESHDNLVAISDDVAAHDIWLITHPEFRRDPKVRAAADFLKDQLSLLKTLFRSRPAPEFDTGSTH